MQQKGRYPFCSFLDVIACGVNDDLWVFFSNGMAEVSSMKGLNYVYVSSFEAAVSGGAKVEFETETVLTL